MNVELAVKDEHGAWELLGDFATMEAAQVAAKEYAALGDDHGVMIFGISEDPESGHYEHEMAISPCCSSPFTGCFRSIESWSG